MRTRVGPQVRSEAALHWERGHAGGGDGAVAAVPRRPGCRGHGVPGASPLGFRHPGAPSGICPQDLDHQRSLKGWGGPRSPASRRSDMQPVPTGPGTRSWSAGCLHAAIWSDDPLRAGAHGPTALGRSHPSAATGSLLQGSTSSRSGTERHRSRVGDASCHRAENETWLSRSFPTVCMHHRAPRLV